MTSPDRLPAVALVALLFAACGGDDAADAGDDASDDPSTSTVVRSQASLAVADGAEAAEQPDATGSTEPSESSAVPEDERFPDVLAAEAEYDEDSGTWTIIVTMSSPYDTPERYADGWRVVGPDGTVYGVHTLAHDHAAEQPFTRRQTSVSIPDGVDEVTVEGRDQHFGFGGDTVTITVQTG